jgi:hypothetical protein
VEQGNCRWTTNTGAYRYYDDDGAALETSGELVIWNAGSSCGCGADLQQHQLTLSEARELRDALDKWINEGGAHAGSS